MPVNSVGKLVVEPAVRLPAKLAIRLSVELAVRMKCAWVFNGRGHSIKNNLKVNK
jgi:hypothetical protein